MNSRNLSTLSILVALSAGVSLGCASTAANTKPEDGADQASVAEPAPTEQKRTMSATTPELGPIYFETDRATLQEDARTMLKAYAKAILEDTNGVAVTVNGHCDERGSEEYNMALGERRAAVVSRYLANLGVPATRLRTVSRGEMDPVAMGHDESVWRLNRRAEISPDTGNLALR